MGISNPDARISFAQFGEDLVLWSILDTRKRLDHGFYVDVGAFHPFRYSNTALLHLYRGWRGINIDANPEATRLFAQHRPADLNITAAISDLEEEAEYVLFDHGAVNTLDPAMAKLQVSAPNTPFHVTNRVNVSTRRLDNILGEIASLPSQIDLLTVDCEGLDYKVLLSNDWDRYRPFVVMVESHKMDFDHAANEPSHVLLTQRDYRLISRAFVTSIYVDDTL